MRDETLGRGREGGGQRENANKRVAKRLDKVQADRGRQSVLSYKRFHLQRSREYCVNTEGANSPLSIPLSPSPLPPYSSSILSRLHKLKDPLEYSQANN